MPKPGVHINALDTAREEPKDFLIDRPGGGGDYLFIHLLAPARLLTLDGMCHGLPGQCLVYSPGQAQWFRGEGSLFTNDFIHAEGDEAARAWHAYGLPLGRLFHPHAGPFIHESIGAMAMELARRDPHWEAALSLQFHAFCLGLSRRLHQHEGMRTTPRQREILERCRRVRTRMLDTLEGDWTVPRMAAEVHLSRTRFSVVYREFFGVSPREDLIRERLRRACWLLSRGAHTVAETAAQCGFESVCHFSRMFHKRVGCAPRDYQGRP